MDLPSLKSALSELEPIDFVSQHIIGGQPKHLNQEQLEYIRVRICEAVRIDIPATEINIVGSAKIGFGLFRKKLKHGGELPAFRPFGPESDIDVAICSSQLFDQAWVELCDFAIAKPWLPHIMKNTGNYLVYGWLRPDQVPREARLRTLDLFQDRMRDLSRSSELGRRKVSGALYRDLSFLSKYQARGISLCRKELSAT